MQEHIMEEQKALGKNNIKHKVIFNIINVAIG